MIRIEHVDVWGFEGAIRGARNPMNSWGKCDSTFSYDEVTHKVKVKLGPNDLSLLRRLYHAGTEHRKYMRQIMVSADVTAPFYWWKQFDTYKVGVTANSCSTMHKLTYKEFEKEDFSVEHLLDPEFFDQLLKKLNGYRDWYLNYDALLADGTIPPTVSKKDIWWQMIELLPESYNQKRTVTFNYENAINMINQRSGHKLDEWHVFAEEMKHLPCLAQIMED